MDLTFRTERGRFNYRAGALIVKNDEVLLVTNAASPYYYSVGGRVKYGETAKEAVEREVFEETGVNITAKRLVFIHENFFDEQVTGERYHEISFFYEMEPPEDFEPICMSFTEGDHSERLVWLRIEKLRDYTVYPLFLADFISKIGDAPIHIITKGQENFIE